MLTSEEMDTGDRNLAWVKYLRGILFGRVTGYTDEEYTSAVAMFRRDLYCGRRLILNGIPMELLLEVENDSERTETSQLWLVRPLFVVGEDYELRILARDRVTALHSVNR